MKVLNLYAGIGGNRKLWKDVEVTAIEYNEEIGGIYKSFFPNDNVIIADAHDYLLKYYKDYDFIWSSPPCPTHSRFSFMTSKMKPGTRGNGIPKYIDLKLWQEIVFLRHYMEGKWVIENVVPYYDPLIKPTVELQRHLFWSNFSIIETKNIEEKIFDIKNGRYDKPGYFDLSEFKITHRKDQILNNCVNPDLGLYILEQSMGIAREKKTNQIPLFI